MTLRTASLLLLGFMAGYVAAIGSMAIAANEVERTDRFMRALRLRFGARTEGLG